MEVDEVDEDYGMDIDENELDLLRQGHFGGLNCAVILAAVLKSNFHHQRSLPGSVMRARDDEQGKNTYAPTYRCHC